MGPAARAQSKGPAPAGRPSYSGATTVSLTHVRNSAVSVSMRRVHPSDAAPAAPVGTGVGGGLVVNGALVDGPNGITGTDPTNADTAIFGRSLGSRLGQYVDGAGDVNGDGYVDAALAFMRLPLMAAPGPTATSATQ